MRFFQPKEWDNILLAAYWQQIYSYVNVVKKHYLTIEDKKIHPVCAEATLRSSLRAPISNIDQRFLQKLLDKLAARLRHIHLKLDAIKAQTTQFIHPTFFFEPPIIDRNKDKSFLATFYLEKENNKLLKMSRQENNQKDDRLTTLTKQYFHYNLNFRAYACLHDLITEQLSKTQLRWWQRLWR